MKHLYLTLITFLFFSQAFAQKDFRPGFIVQNGDTLQGYVDYRGAVRSSKTTAFKSTLDAAEQSFTPAQLAGYGFGEENKVYESKTVQATEGQPEQLLFLHALVKGKASLYTYRDETDRDRFYLSKDEAALVELSEKIYTRIDPKSGKRHRVVDKPYLGVLASAFLDCPDLTEKRLENVILRHSSLVKVANEYNQCMGSTQHIQEPKKTTVAFAPVLVFSIPSLQMYGEHRYAKGTYRNTGLGLGAGVAMEVSNPNMSEKLSLVLELLYAPYRFEGELMNVSTTYDVLFDLNYIKMPAQLRYTFPKGRIRPFANAGGSFSYAISTERLETKFQNTALEGSSFKNNMFGYMVGAGLIVPARSKAFLLEARYEKTEGISNLLNLGSNIQSFSLMAGYRF